MSNATPSPRRSRVRSATAGIAVPTLALPTLLALASPLTACRTAPHPATRPEPVRTPSQPEPAGWITLAEGLRINRATHTVEFDANVAMDCHNPATPDVYLELIACTPDSREHESLVVTDVPPSLIHAALLAIGAEPGAPADLATSTPPSGDAVTVAFTESNTATPATIQINNWITDAPTRTRRPDLRFVFAGSRDARPNAPIAYDADGTGVIVGLATFGSEVIANADLINPSADIDEPIWIADPRAVPKFNTSVRVRLTTSLTPNNAKNDAKNDE